MIYHLKFKYFYRTRKSFFFGNSETGYREMIIKVESENEFQAIQNGYNIILNYKSKHDGDLFSFNNGKELNDNKFMEIVREEKSFSLKDIS